MTNLVHATAAQFLAHAFHRRAFAPGQHCAGRPSSTMGIALEGLAQ